MKDLQQEYQMETGRLLAEINGLNAALLDKGGTGPL
jgi:hypothetical protein